MDDLNQFVETDETKDWVELRRQPDGPGLRYGKRAEASLLIDLTPETLKLVRERLGQYQAESRYYEERVGTVQDVRFILLNNDTQGLITVTYDGDFVPYLADIIRGAGVWFDRLLNGVWPGYTSASDEPTKHMILQNILTAEMFYVRHHDLTVKDVTRLKRLGAAVTELFDAAN
jgi:hypothetical protein